MRGIADDTFNYSIACAVAEPSAPRSLEAYLRPQMPRCIALQSKLPASGDEARRSDPRRGIRCDTCKNVGDAILVHIVAENWQAHLPPTPPKTQKM